VIGPVAGRPYSNPYVAGVGLGVVLLAAFVIMGRGLGASGAFASAAAAGALAVAPEATKQSHYFARYLTSTGTPAMDWIVIEVVGVMIGGFLSALLAGRLRRTIERGPRISKTNRLKLAFGGGSVMGVGAVIARGCTSGQGLTGGAMLSVGGWLFIAAAFAAAYLVAPVVRRAWT
jgi:uncharacterized protein